MVSTAVIVFDGRITEFYFWECCSSVVTVEFRCFIFQLHATIPEELDSTAGLIFSSGMCEPGDEFPFQILRSFV